MSRLNRSDACLVLVVVIFTVSMILLSNNQLVYGGYDGLLFKGLKGLRDAQDLALSGSLVVSGWTDSEAVDEGLNLSLFFDGVIDQEQSKGVLDFYTKYGETVSSEPIGQLVMDRGECHVVSDLMLEAITFHLGNLLSGNVEGFDVEVMLNKFLDEAIVESIIVEDSRSGYHQLKHRVSSYIYEESMLKVTVYVDEKAVLTDLFVVIEIDEVTVDASVVFKYDVYGG